jgi:hypothetical protein
MLTIHVILELITRLLPTRVAEFARWCRRSGMVTAPDAKAERRPAAPLWLPQGRFRQLHARHASRELATRHTSGMAKEMTAWMLPTRQRTKRMPTGPNT